MSHFLFVKLRVQYRCSDNFISNVVTFLSGWARAILSLLLNILWAPHAIFLPHESTVFEEYHYNNCLFWFSPYPFDFWNDWFFLISKIVCLISVLIFWFPKFIRLISEMILLISKIVCLISEMGFDFQILYVWFLKWTISIAVINISARRIATSGQVNLLSIRRKFFSKSQPIRFVRLDSEHAQNDG